MPSRDLAHEHLTAAQVALHRARFLEVHDRLQDALRVVQPVGRVRPRDRTAGRREPIDIGLEPFLCGDIGVLPFAGAEGRERRWSSVVGPPPLNRLARHCRDESRDLLDRAGESADLIERV